MKHSISTDIKPPLIDLDIKLYNMVLGLPQDDYYPAYPTVKMIDFGEAFEDDRYFYYEAKEGGVGTEGFGPRFVSQSFTLLFFHTHTYQGQI